MECCQQGGGGKFESVCNVNGKAVAGPDDAERVLVAGPCFGHRPPCRHCCKQGSQIFVCVQRKWEGSGGAVLCEKVLVADPATGQASAMDPRH